MSARMPTLCLLLLAVACGSAEDAGSPRDAGSEAASDAAKDAKAPEPDAGPAVRSVEVRDPFGDLTREQNLMVDGDFEFTAGQAQYGWQAVANGAIASIPRETGGLCRSGVCCASIDSSYTLVGFAVAAADQSMELSLWSKPPVPDCTLTVVSLINCDSVVLSTMVTIPTENDVPDADGWCHHLATTPPITQRPCFVVESYAEPETHTLIDQGSIHALESAPASTLLAGAPDQERFQRVQMALRVLRQRMPIGRAVASRP